MRTIPYLLMHLLLGIMFGLLAAWMETRTFIEYFIWIVPVVVTFGVTCVAAAVYSIVRRSMGDVGGAWVVSALALAAVTLLVFVAGGMTAFSSLEVFSRFAINYVLFFVPTIVAAFVVQFVVILRPRVIGAVGAREGE